MIKKITAVLSTLMLLFFIGLGCDKQYDDQGFENYEQQRQRQDSPGSGF